jgi:hypothetical protein
MEAASTAWAHRQHRDLAFGAQESGIGLKAAGYLAVAALCLVSIGANMRFGMSLGTTIIDRAVYGLTSVAVDICKMLMPLLAGRLWAKRQHSLAVSALLLGIGCMCWSSASAVGFALSTRADAVAERAAEAKMRTGWAATVQRAEAQLDTLGRHRLSSIVQADLATVSVPSEIWGRTKHCADVTLPDSRAACEPVLRLRLELAAAEAAERLERQVAAGRQELATVPVAGSDSDVQAAALARLTGASQPTARTALALLLASLVEAGSALGFTILATATMRNPPRATANPAPITREAAVPRTRHTTTTYGATLLQAPTRPGATGDLIRRWALTRLDVVPGSAIPARDAYRNFCQYAREHGREPCSETGFGRAFTAECGSMGGHKQKRRDRALYVGIALRGELARTT